MLFIIQKDLQNYKLSILLTHDSLKMLYEPICLSYYLNFLIYQIFNFIKKIKNRNGRNISSNLGKRYNGII